MALPEGLLDDVRRIAVVGLSSRPDRFSYGVAVRLQSVGYEIVPVNPHENEVLGVPAVATLEEIDGPVDLVNVFRRAVHAPEIARGAVTIGARILWLQTGIRSAEARRIAEDGGLTYIEDRCLGLVA
jgi:uncharacterized protein